MVLEFQNRRFQAVLCSDNEPDSMYLEINDISKGSKTVVEIRYVEDDGSMTFTAFEENLPFELIEHFGLTARKSLFPVAQAAE